MSCVRAYCPHCGGVTKICDGFCTRCGLEVEEDKD